MGLWGKTPQKSDNLEEAKTMALTENELIDLLGTMTDWELSQKTGMHISKIFRIREELGIPTPSGDLGRKKKIYWTQEMDASLGTMSDRALADRFGIDPRAVRKHRRKLGVPASRSYRRRK